MLRIINHPLINHKLTIMRKAETDMKDFRENLDEIAGLMAFEITDKLQTEKIRIKTPITETFGYRLKNKVILIPILRTGLGMVDGIRKVIPTAKIGHIGLYRDEKTLQPHEYYVKFPEGIKQATIFILDPMLATGNSAVAAIDLIKKHGGKNIKLICLVGVKQGVDRVSKAHPDVDIFLAALDKKLNKKGFIVPGLGDAGDRLYGTK
jgi:uracil phosphoribosyltransferase